jgi:hypothetical protein
VHVVDATDEIWGYWWLLTYITPDPADGKLAFTESAARSIMDEAVAESERSKLPITLTFSTVVLSRNLERIRQDVRRENGEA